MRILRGQKEQNVSVKLGTFPSGKELAKVETGSRAAEPQGDRDGPAGPDAWRPGTGANKDGVVITNVDSASDAAQKGIKSGDVILEIGDVTREEPRGRRQWRQGGRQARAQGRSDAGQVRRSDPLRAGPVEEELNTLLQRVCQGEAACSC